MERFNRYIILLLIVLASVWAKADVTAPVDSIPALTADTLQAPKGNLVSRVVDYFSKTNSQQHPKQWDMSFIGGPYYATETKLGIGLVAAAIYSTAPYDTLTPLSNLSIYGDISTTGYFKIGVGGNNIFSRDKQRLDYSLDFEWMPDKFWGIGYGANTRDDNETPFNRLSVKLKAEWLWHVGQGMYIGPMAGVTLMKGERIKGSRSLWQGDDLTTISYGGGFTLMLDTRDNLTSPHRGIYLVAKQMFFPSFIGNKYQMGYTELLANHYRPLWSGCTLAACLHGDFRYGDVPWGMLATFGGSHYMRGYFEGRYRDKCEIDCTVEFRQHLWGRNGVAVWGGLGTVFPRLSDIRARGILPNYGLGYRWEFKKNVNVRVDLGFGRNCLGFLFGINEAF